MLGLVDFSLRGLGLNPCHVLEHKANDSVQCTIEPRQYGHQRDMIKCPYYPAVLVKRANLRELYHELF